MSGTPGVPEGCCKGVGGAGQLQTPRGVLAGLLAHYARGKSADLKESGASGSVPAPAWLSVTLSSYGGLGERQSVVSIFRHDETFA